MRVHGVMITYRRPGVLAATLDAVAGQTRQLDSLLIVDNDPHRSAEHVSPTATYLATGENLGPAGGFAVALDHLLPIVGADDWVLLLDDDNPPDQPGILADLVGLAEQLPADVAATGLVGGRYNRRTGQTVRVPDVDLIGLVEVDWIGGGQLPVYRAAALREVRPRPGLFFGYEELDLGLRLRRSGWHLVVDGARWASLRASRGRRNLSPRNLRDSASASGWRRYYSTRNLVAIARRERPSTFVVACGYGLLRTVWLIRTDRRGAAMTFRGVVDGALGRAGRRVEPGY